ncbi:MAG: sporulation integral membrane protein YtvI [Thermacetogeniaceae bacterium]|nr:sporulation integral membrane protein YtvI [Syntrophomonadaceae bacterium]
MSPSLEKVVMFFLKTLTVLLLGAGIYFFVRNFWPLLADMLANGIKILIPFFLAYLIAVILNPLIKLLEKRLRFPRTLGTLFSMIIFLFLIGGIFYVLISNLVQELVDLSIYLTNYSRDLNEWTISMGLEKLQYYLEKLNIPSNIIEEAGKELWESLDVIKGIVSGFLTHFFNFAAALPQYFVLLVLTFIISFFFARDYDLIKDNVSLFFQRWISEKWNKALHRVSRCLQRALHGYIKAIAILISITGFLSLIGLSIFGVRYAYVLALVVALLDLLPVVGPGTVYVPWGIMMLITGEVRFGIGLLILYGIIVVVRQILEPKLVGENIGLHPLTTLVSLYLGYKLLGFWGFIIGPAVVIIYKAFVKNDD